MKKSSSTKRKPLSPLVCDIVVPVIGRRLLWLVGDPKIAGPFLRHYLPLVEDAESMLEGPKVAAADGCHQAFIAVEGGDGVAYIWLREFDRMPTAAQFGKFAHEIFHALMEMSRRVGMKGADGDAEEWYAYMTGYITEKLLDGWGRRVQARLKAQKDRRRGRSVRH